MKTWFLSNFLYPPDFKRFLVPAFKSGVPKPWSVDQQRSVACQELIHASKQSPTCAHAGYKQHVKPQLPVHRKTIFHRTQKVWGGFKGRSTCYKANHQPGLGCSGIFQK
uniref:Uncharacterized protein n=1 Tax=Micrurus lemniscatus lemniscatus TaxID=129467 RepID=A0A2D4J412_MICLE